MFFYIFKYITYKTRLKNNNFINHCSINIWFLYNEIKNIHMHRNLHFAHFERVKYNEFYITCNILESCYNSYHYRLYSFIV